MARQVGLLGTARWQRLVGVEQREVALVLLSEVQAQDRVQAVKRLLQLSDVIGLWAFARERIEKSAEPPDQVADLRVRPTHRARRVMTTEHPVEHRVELCILCFLVRQ